MITRNINDDNTLSYLFQKDSKATGNVKAELDAFRAEVDAFRGGLINFVYPVGSIYMSTNNVSPQTFLGGTWERITGRFLLAATDGGAAGGNSNASIAPGNTGGEATHKLTTAEMPGHTHKMDAYYDQSGYGKTLPASSHRLLTAGVSWTGSALSNRNVAVLGPTGSAGSNGVHNNMPPYLAVYMWKRTA